MSDSTEVVFPQDTSTVNPEPSEQLPTESPGPAQQFTSEPNPEALLPSPGFPGPEDGSPTIEGDLPYPGPDGQDLALTQTLVAMADDPYPRPESIENFTATPVTGLSPTPTMAEPYPGPVTNLTPSPTSVFAGTPSLTPMFTRTPTPTGVLVSTPTNAFNFPGTPTFEPTPTPLPTSTRTPIPPPPWVSSNLQATDPDTVILRSGKVQLIWFFAFWDGPSQGMAPLIHALEDQYGIRINFVYLDIDDPATDPFKDELGYRSQPEFFLLDGEGRVLRQWQGYVSITDFQQAFEAALQ